MRLYPKWFNGIVGILFFAGVLSVLYVLVVLLLVPLVGG